MKRLLQLVLWFLVGTLVGFPLGMYWTNRTFVQNADAVGQLGEEATIDYFAKAQYRHADRESARQALQYAIQIHQKMEGAKLHDRFAQMDLGYCYGELALLEESEGNLGLAHDYMQHAVQALKEAGLKKPNPTEQYIRERLNNQPFVDASLPVKGK